METKNQENEQNNRHDRGNKSGWGYIFVSIFLLLSTVFLIIFFVYTFFVPNNPLNPFPPGIETEIYEVVESVPSPTSTKTPEPTATTKPFPDVIPTLETGILFEVQTGTPFYLPHQSGCSYMYVAGSILDLNGEPVAGYTVRLSGVINDHPEILFEAVSGSALQYSAGGFEIQIGEIAPVDGQNGIYLQLFLEDGTPASPMISFSTSGDCNRNMIHINFIQVRN